jgi:hypothetical protein
MATRLTLRTNARIRADQDNSTFPSDAAYNMYIDRGAGYVWRKLVHAGWKPDRTILTVTATGANPALYTLAADVSIVHSVDRVDGATRTPIPRVKPEELAGLLTQGTGPALRYELVGGATTTMQIEFWPRPASGAYEVRYTKRFAGFTADGDIWNGPDGSDELIELYAAMLGTQKENGDAGDLQRMWTERYTEVCAIAGFTDAKGVQTVRDARGENPGTDPFSYNVREGWNW